MVDLPGTARVTARRRARTRVFLVAAREGCANSVSCGEVVFVDEAAEPVAAFYFDDSFGQGGESLRGRARRSEGQRAVRPVAVVVVDENAEYAFEVAAVRDQ
jgi:hypothetical protein